MPGRAVDGFQGLITRTFHRVGVAVAWVLEKSLAGAEGGVETVLNIGTPASHRQTTVFLRLPVDVYRAHEAWCLAHRRTLYIGSAEELATLTHAALFHPGLHRRRVPWWRGDPAASASTVIMVTTTRTMAHAPPALRPYVVPIAWALDAVMTATP